MSTNSAYIVRCDDCGFISDVLLDERLALNERDFHALEKLHSVAIWRYAWENWTLVKELQGVHLK